VVRTEDQHRFTVAPEEDVDNINLIITCERCGHGIFCGGLATLADLIDAADEHTEVCR